MTRKTASRIRITRRIVQALSLCLIILLIWNTRYPLSGFVNPAFLFMIDPLVMFITAIAERVLLAGLILASIHILLTFIFGRFFCGWICPLGTCIDIAGALKSSAARLFRTRVRESGPGTTRLTKYLLLASLVTAALFGIQLAWFFDPITIFVRAFSFTIHPALNAALDGALSRTIIFLDYPEWLESFYEAIHGPILTTSLAHFPHTVIAFAVFIVICLASLIRRRFWCRYLCPVGASLAIPAVRPLLHRDATACVSNCGSCRDICRTGAIRSDNTYAAEECILCMDCVAVCPRETASTFTMKRAGAKRASGGGISRARFISLAAGTIASIAVPRIGSAAAGRKRSGKAAHIRPPGSIPEEEFVQRCVRCGNCMKVCPTNLLQPIPLFENTEAAWTPVMDFDRGYCEYGCALCGRVCPTEAIRELRLKDKQSLQIGVAIINQKACLPYAKGENCIVCEEHCPVPDKAIKIRNGMVRGRRVHLPYVIPSLCIGCGICEHKCPIQPDKGITISALRKV